MFNILILKETVCVSFIFVLPLIEVDAQRLWVIRDYVCIIQKHKTPCCLSSSDTMLLKML